MQMLRWPRTKPGSPSATGRGFEFQLRKVFYRGYKPFSSDFKIDCIKTLAPFATSEAVVNSFGEWLIPLTREDHSDWNHSRKILSIVPCAAWHQLRGLHSSIQTISAIR
jgi:hypothetical protein